MDGLDGWYVLGYCFYQFNCIVTKIPEESWTPNALYGMDALTAKDTEEQRLMALNALPIGWLMRGTLVQYLMGFTLTTCAATGRA